MYIPVYVYIQCISIWNFLLFVYLFNHISTHLFIFMCVYIDFGVTTMCDIFVFIMCYLLKPDRLVPIKHDCNYCKALNSYRWAVVIALEWIYYSLLQGYLTSVHLLLFISFVIFYFINYKVEFFYIFSLYFLFCCKHFAFIVQLLFFHF